MCGELERDWLGDDMTDPIEKRRAALRDLGRGMEWARNREGLWGALDALLKEAAAAVPHALQDIDNDVSTRRDSNGRMYTLRLPEAASRGDLHRYSLFAEDFGEQAAVHCKIQNTLKQHSVELTFEQAGLPMLLPVVRHSIIEFLDSWTSEVKQRVDITPVLTRGSA